MKIAVRAASYMFVSGLLAAGTIGACNGDDSSPGVVSGGNNDSGTTSSDAGANDNDTGTVKLPPGTDAGGTDAGGGADTSVAADSSPGTDATSPADSSAADTGSATDAAHASDTSIADSSATDSSSGDAADGAAPQTFCGSQTGLDFCEDFDNGNPLSLDAGTADFWTALVSTGTELALSTAQAASPPSSLLVALPDGTVNGDRSAKVVKMITPTNGVSQAIYEFDMYIATVPLANTGGFATDFQFQDDNGSDTFGFRIGVFSNTTGFDHADLEHNHPSLGGSDDITSPVGITFGAWNHVKMVVAYSALANDGGNNVAFQLYLNRSTTADLNANYPAPFPKATFARFAAGVVYAFDAQNKGWSIYYDNFTLKLQ
jgi:hypothetical protein